jgi:hypothetical protein
MPNKIAHKYVKVYLKTTIEFPCWSDLKGDPWNKSKIKNKLNSEEADACPLGLPNSLEQEIGLIKELRTQGLGSWYESLKKEIIILSSVKAER